jgi:hypothetical protein
LRTKSEPGRHCEASSRCSSKKALKLSGSLHGNWMVALTGQFCHSLRIFTYLATVFLFLGGNTATGRVCTFLDFSHLVTSITV